MLKKLKLAILAVEAAEAATVAAFNDAWAAGAADAAAWADWAAAIESYTNAQDKVCKILEKMLTQYSYTEFLGECRAEKIETCC